MHQCIDSKLQQALVGYLQLTHTIKLFSHLDVMQVTGEKVHDGLKLMQQVSFHITIVHLIAEHCAHQDQSRESVDKL